MAEQEDGKVKTWFPLESNPEVMTQYCERMGLDVSEYVFQDVLSTDEWALEMIPRPCLGVLLLFPIKDAAEDHRFEEKAKIDADGQIVSPSLYYMTQTVGNACGTVGLLHLCVNAKNKVNIASGSYLDKFTETTSALNAEERAKWLEEDEEIEETHQISASEGQSDQIAIEDDVISHFVCFTHVDGHLYELDGRKSVPINHGASTEETLLEDSVRVIKKFMERDPEETRFSIVVLAKRPEEEEEN